MQLKVDLHVHTIYSHDSIITPKDLVFYAQKNGMSAVAVTDHNVVKGARKIAKETEFPVIPGTEVSSLNGHIVGLNVQEPIPRGLSADETVELIHKAGGLAVACHPFALWKGSIGKYVNRKFDAVETLNASTFPFRSSSRKADEVAEKLKLPKVAGTDAHYGPIIGRAYTIIEAEPDVESMVKAIANGQCMPRGKAISLAMRVENQGRFFKKYMRTRGKTSRLG